MGDVSATLDVSVRRHVVDAQVSVPLDPAKVTVLFGPSGSGKTTILRAIAGLDGASGSRIVFDGEEWDDGQRLRVPTRDRRVGLLFQDHALFPHMSVAENVAYGLIGMSRAERAERVQQSLEATAAEHLIDRMVNSLSGGEAQRVALARAIAPKPRLLLLDEPLSALDAPMRSRLRGEIRRILTDQGIPAIVVTHDRTEALALADHAVVLIEGRVVESGPVLEVFDRPKDSRVVDVVGMETALPASVVDVVDGVVRVTVESHTITSAFVPIAEGNAPSTFVVGDEALVCIRAEDVSLELPGARSRGSQRNHLPGVVQTVSPEGVLVRVEVDIGVPLAALITRPAAIDLDLQPGSPVAAVVKSTSVHLIKR